MRILIFLFVVLSFSCEAQATFQSLISEQGSCTPSATQTADCKEVFWLIGDSIGRGNSDAVGSTPTANTVFQWDAGTSSVVQVGATDLIEVAAIKTPNGSPWPRFGIDYNAATGKKATFVCTAIGGASWYRASGASSWYTNGTLYSDATTKLDNALSNMGLTLPKAVFIICGYNDLIDSYTLSYTYLTSLIDRINTDYPGTKIYVGIPEYKAAVTTTLSGFIRLQTMKEYVKQLSFDYANVELAMNLHNLNYWGSNYQVDDIHLNFAGNELIGSLLSRQVNLNQSYHKYARSILGMMWTNHTTTRQNLINAFITDQDADGNLTELDHLYNFKMPDARDCVMDWGMLHNSVVSLATFTANSYVTTDGSSNRIIGPFITLTQDKSSVTSDAIYGARIATNVDGTGVDGRLFGVREANSGSVLFELAQTSTTEIAYRMNDGTTRLFTGDGYFVNDALHSLYRSGTGRGVIKNTTSQDATTQAAGAATGALYSLGIGARVLGDVSGIAVIDNYLACQFVYFYGAKYTTFDLTTFYADMETLITNW